MKFDSTINTNSEQQRAMLLRIERKGWRNYTDTLEAARQATDSEQCCSHVSSQIFTKKEKHENVLGTEGLPHLSPAQELARYQQGSLWCQDKRKGTWGQSLGPRRAVWDKGGEANSLPVTAMSSQANARPFSKARGNQYLKDEAQRTRGREGRDVRGGQVRGKEEKQEEKGKCLPKATAHGLSDVRTPFQTSTLRQRLSLQIPPAQELPPRFRNWQSPYPSLLRHRSQWGEPWCGGIRVSPQGYSRTSYYCYAEEIVHSFSRCNCYI